MRVPKRKSEEVARLLKQHDDHLTQDKVDKMKIDLKRLLKTERPTAIKEMQRLAEMGDFSENAGYQNAKWHLRRINSRILRIQEQLKVAIVIKSGPDSEGRARVGSTVLLHSNGKQFEFEIVGSQETRPDRGRISHNSPLGVSLIGHKAGETVTVSLNDQEVEYDIVEIR